MDDRTSDPSPEPVTTESTPATAPATTATAPVATAPAATTPPDDAGGASAPPEPEAQEGGAGDEEGIRVPVDLVVSADGVDPPTVSVPAFLAVEISARSGDGRPHTVEVAGVTLEVPATGTATAQADGLRSSSYPITVDGTRRGELIAGQEPGP